MPTRGGECSNGGGFIFMWFKSRYLEKKNVDSIVDFFYTIDTNQPVCINQTIKKRTVRICDFTHEIDCPQNVSLFEFRTSDNIQAEKVI